MRFLLPVVAFVGLLLLGGCSSENYRMDNPSHVGRHFTCICDDLHEFHMDIDMCLFGIYECDPELTVIE